MTSGVASAIVFGPTAPTLTRSWHLFDARNQIVGHLAQRAAILLQGKHRPTWTPHVDTGDTVVIVNAEKVRFTGNKWNTKLYRYHTGFPGGLKEIVAREMLQKHPTFILRKAIMGMLYKNTFKHSRGERLKIYVGPDHPHQAQFPTSVMEKWEKERIKEEKDDKAVETYSKKMNPIVLEEKREAKREEKEKVIMKMVEDMDKANEKVGGKLGTMVGMGKKAAATEKGQAGTSKSSSDPKSDAKSAGGKSPPKAAPAKAAPPKK